KALLESIEAKRDEITKAFEKEAEAELEKASNLAAGGKAADLDKAIAAYDDWITNHPQRSGADAPKPNQTLAQTWNKYREKAKSEKNALLKRRDELVRRGLLADQTSFWSWIVDAYGPRDQNQGGLFLRFNFTAAAKSAQKRAELATTAEYRKLFTDR